MLSINLDGGSTFDSSQNNIIEVVDLALTNLRSIWPFLWYQSMSLHWVGSQGFLQLSWTTLSCWKSCSFFVYSLFRKWQNWMKYFLSQSDLSCNYLERHPAENHFSIPLFWKWQNWINYLLSLFDLSCEINPCQWIGSYRSLQLYWTKSLMKIFFHSLSIPYFETGWIG